MFCDHSFLAAIVRGKECCQTVAMRDNGLGQIGDSDVERMGQIPDIF